MHKYVCLSVCAAGTDEVNKFPKFWEHAAPTQPGEDGGAKPVESGGTPAGESGGVTCKDSGPADVLSETPTW